MKSTPTIPWKTRCDLDSFEQGDGADVQIAVKDQITNEFYHFGELEFSILEILKEPTTVEELKHQINFRFGVRLSTEALLRYIHRLAHDNLLVARALGDGQRLHDQQERLRKAAWLQGVMGILSIRFPGFHPGGLLRLLRFPGWLCFHPLVVLAGLAFAGLTLLFAILANDTLLEKAPSFTELMQPGHLASVLVGFILAKLLHELGHGLACQRTGHECTEMGLMILVGIPCMYCDVSDLWTEKNRWKRILVSLAGVFVELGIATVCFWGWYFSVDGAVHRWLFSMMLITSVNTLFINGNPLMRYDGYYALSDLLGIPNLAGAARNVVQQRWRGWFVAGEARFTLNERTNTLVTYGVLAGIYRCFIMLAIGWGVWSFFDAQQLRSLGTLSVSGVILLTLIPMAMSFRGFAGEVWDHGLRVTNVVVLVAIIGLLAAFLANFEFNYRVFGNAEIQLADARPLFAPASGQFSTDFSDGQRLQQDDIVGVIRDPDLELELIETRGELQEIEARLKSLRLLDQASQTEGQLAFWQQRQETVRRRNEELVKRFDSLTLIAPHSGQLIASQIRYNPGEIPEGALLPLSGNRFEVANRDNHVERGMQLAYIGDPNRYRGFLKIDETEIELVKLGYPVRLYLPNSSRVAQGKVTRISLEGEGELTSPEVNADNLGEPLRFFRVEFELPVDDQIRVGSKHWVVIECETTTPLGYLQRWWRNSFWY